jgi:hypothetical protein
MDHRSGSFAVQWQVDRNRSAAETAQQAVLEYLGNVRPPYGGGSSRTTQEGGWLDGRRGLRQLEIMR